jgi:hypothetical protein
MRRKLGMDASRPAVLLVGGGEGMGKLEQTVDEIAAQMGPQCQVGLGRAACLQGQTEGGRAAPTASPSSPETRPVQVVVVCGRNATLLEKLRAKGSPNGLVLRAAGFVDNLHEWMAAADVIVTKAGPGTIAEALISGLPILLNGNIPCQEEGNIPYVVNNKVRARAWLWAWWGLVGPAAPGASAAARRGCCCRVLLLQGAAAAGCCCSSQGEGRGLRFPAVPAGHGTRADTAAMPSSQVGAFETRPAQIAALLKQWFGPRQAEFQQMARNSRALGRPEAVYKISRDLAAMTGQARLQVQPLAAA